MNDHALHLEDLTSRIRPSAASSVLLWMMVAFTVVFVIWAALTELDRTVRGVGRVVPSSQLQVVSNLEGGLVEQIFAQTGDEVRVGEPLIRLDPTLTSSELGSGEVSAQALAAKIARLEAEVAGTTPKYPPAGSREAAEQVASEQALFAARTAELASILAASRARVIGAERAVAEAEAAYRARSASRDARRAEVEVLRSLVERGIEPRLSLTQAESSYSIAVSEAAQAAQGVARSKAAVAEARSSLAQQQQNWRSAAASELVAVQAELGARRRALPALAERAERTIVRAPVAGRVNRVLVATRGGTIQPGQPLVEIVPSEDILLIEARIRPQDIASVALGQKANVALTAYDRAIYGTLEGEVSSISPDAILDEASGQTFYTIRVRTSESALTAGSGTVLPIGPGMVAEVDLLGDKRTILEYILSPLTRIRDTALRE